MIWISERIPWVGVSKEEIGDCLTSLWAGQKGGQNSGGLVNGGTEHPGPAPEDNNHSWGSS